jgi:hypothetical protein
MKKEELWIWYVIIGYILLPFIAIFRILKKGTDWMTDTHATFYYFFVIIVIMQLIEVFLNL